MEQLFRKKMWNGGGKKVIDRVWRKISFDCKSNPFFKNAHSNSQKLVKSLRVNHFDSTTTRFRLFCKFGKFVLISEEMGQCHSLSKEMGGPDPKWTTCPHCETRVLTRVVFETFGCFINCFCYIPYKCTGNGKVVLHTCPNCNYVIGKYFKKWWGNRWESLRRIKYIISNKIGLLWWIKYNIVSNKID